MYTNIKSIHSKEINMKNKSTGMIATVATAVICGCCGLFACIFGAVTASGNMPYNTEVNGLQNSGMLPTSVGYVLLCISVIAIIIPIAVGFFTLRKKPEAVTINEPLPPAS
jgi:hypothetical protein